MNSRETTRLHNCIFVFLHFDVFHQFCIKINDFRVSLMMLHVLRRFQKDVGEKDVVVAEAADSNPKPRVVDDIVAGRLDSPSSD